MNRVTLELTDDELAAFINVLECPFSGDEDDVIGMVGEDNVAAAMAMWRKVNAAIVKAKRT